MTSLFNVSLSGRVATITTINPLQFDLDAEYRVRPLRTGVEPVACALVTGAPAVADDDVGFIVETPVPGDINLDCTTGTPDLVVLLGSFGQSVTGCSQNGDLNRDGIVDTADLTILLGGFGQSCAGLLVAGPDRGKVATHALESPQSGAVASVAATPPGPVLAEMGFVSLEAYTAYVGSLTESQFWQHIAEVLGVIDRLGL